MFLVDDLLLFPVKGLAAICRHVQEAARQDLEQQQTATVAGLAELHRQLEAGRVAAGDFDSQETQILERLEQIQQMLAAIGGPGED